MIVAGIINKGRPVSYVRDIIDSVNSQTITPDKIIVSTNKEVYTECEEHDAITVISVNDKNVSSAKNSVIKKAMELGATKLFLLEDDIVIHKDETFEKYLAVLEVLDLGMMSAGYTNRSNYVLTAPSPRIKFDVTGLTDKFDAVVTNRHEVADFILIDLEKNKLSFNEDLDYFEFSEYVYQCWKYSYIPGLNQFFDIPNSWDYVGPRPDCPSERANDVKAISADQKKMTDSINNGWVIENDVKIITDYIIFKLKENKEQV